MGHGVHLGVAGLVLSVVTACLGIGCEARVSLGAECESRSDCPEPYICRQGRCRIECREARDCTFPLECIVEGTANAGGCRVTEDGVCRDDSDCAGSLVCEDARCAQPCTDHSECSVAQVCNGRVCVRNTTIGPCDVLSGTGCDEGERCGIVGMGADRRVECLQLLAGEVRDSELGEACDANPETPQQPCRDGLTCVDGRCLRWCLFDHDAREVDSNCGPGSVCVRQYSGATAPVTCGFCTEGCNPAEGPGSDGCPDGRACALASSQEGVAYGQCVVPVEADCGSDPLPLGCPGGPCTETRQCVAGADCMPIDLTTTLCLERCEDDSDCHESAHCALTEPLRIVVSDGTTREIGVCVPD